MRDRFNAFVSRHDIAWELAMAALAILYLAVGFAIDAAGPDTRMTLEALEIGLTVIFALEFGARFLAARDRRAYLRGHWIDLLALVPPVRGARVLRLLRLLRLIRAFAGLYRAAVHVGALTRHRGFASLIVAWLAVVVLCSTGLYVAEVGVNENIASPSTRSGGASAR